ncbi:NAD(P)/FAD-dependent oxidoreductase [Flaviaesturariibacter amylovorans]|uniref:NAD(P)/FAD-dependent oxidoreductase n=1 Tax=Flaviaesturariibacter amylovorans TaxID=1084520 RepID=A0ABP8GNB4_9BACT
MIVIGGGAAGFFCAVNAARMHPGLKVVLLEKTSKLLSKVRISGGGRCNVTHHLFDTVEFAKRYPRGHNFVKKTFHQFSSAECIDWFAERGVRLKAEADGRMFPVTDSSETVIECLLREAGRYGVDIRMNAEVKTLQKTGDGFVLTLAGGQELRAPFVCVAAGGYPKAPMFDWLRALGHTVADPTPSLFTFNLPKHPITALMGVAVERARVKIEGSKLQEEGPVLITHWGLSGPAVLRLSAWGARELAAGGYSFKAHVHWVPGQTEADLKATIADARKTHPQKKLENHNLGQLPARLWNFLLRQSGISEEQRFADLPAKAENALVRALTDTVFHVEGKTTFKEEFVTAGGIQLSEVDPNTMMSRKVPGLYFAGEVLDVDGITGGFNFQHAWTSGWIAAGLKGSGTPA